MKKQIIQRQKNNNYINFRCYKKRTLYFVTILNSTFYSRYSETEQKGSDYLYSKYIYLSRNSYKKNKQYIELRNKEDIHKMLEILQNNSILKDSDGEYIIKFDFSFNVD